MKTLQHLSGLVIASLVLCTAASAQTIQWAFLATGSEQVPPNAGTATAYGVVSLNTSTNMLSWDITHKALTGSHTATHFHGPAAAGSNAGVQLNLGTGNPLVGSAPLTGAQASDLIAGLWYFNIHTSGFPGGEARGQVDHTCADRVWGVHADGSEPVPPTGSTETADGTIVLDEGSGMITWNLPHTGMTGTHTATHLHGPAAIGSNGPIQVDLGTGNPVAGSAFLTTKQTLDLIAGLFYVNFHSSAFPGGEIRGQVDDVAAQAYCSALANSFSATGARLFTTGDFVVTNNNLIFSAVGVPPSNFGYMLVGAGSSSVMPPGSSGNLCLIGAAIGRYNGQVKVSDGSGVMGPFNTSLVNLPTIGGNVNPGETWNFQTWFRDGMTNNFSDGVGVTFQ